MKARTTLLFLALLTCLTAGGSALFYFQEEDFLSYICELGVCDGISPWKTNSVDNLPFDPHHKNKLQHLLAIATSSPPVITRSTSS